jgi:hypothetical protein
MIPVHKLNQAYDALNLPRDASIQAARDRIAALRGRLGASSDAEKLRSVEDAFNTIERADAYLAAQRDSITSRTKSKSERLLDGKLAEISAQAASGAEKRPVTELDESSKKMKRDESPPLKPEEGQQDEAKVFTKLNTLLKDESKYLRSMNVLFNVLDAFIEKGQFDQKIADLISDTLDVAISTTKADGSRLANGDEDNRRVSTKVVNRVLASDELRGFISNEKIKIWMHAVLFRNSLFEVDNFNFVSRCKELQGLVREAREASEQWLDQLTVSIETLASKNVYRVIPGRINEVKSTMIEIYKMTRFSGYTKVFQDKIAEIQKQFMCSL